MWQRYRQRCHRVRGKLRGSFMEKIKVWKTEPNLWVCWWRNFKRGTSIFWSENDENARNDWNTDRQTAC